MSRAMIVAAEPHGGAVTPEKLGGFQGSEDDSELLFRMALACEKRVGFAAEVSHLSAPAVGCTNEGREVKNLTSFLTYWVDALRKREEGQTMAEYGVVLAVITVAVVVALGILSGAIADALDRVTGMLGG
jgi:Flp pilus assembly pilin Flp